MMQLGPGEHIVLEVRHHWYILFAETAFLALLAFLVAVVFAFMGAVGVSIDANLFSLISFLSFAWLLILWIFFFIIWTNYYLDVWIVTNRRVIDVEQHYLFSREVSEFKLEKIQDITIEVHGILPTLLHFGDINVQTAGQTKRFIFRHAPYPDDVKTVIFREHDALMGNTKRSEDKGVSDA